MSQTLYKLCFVYSKVRVNICTGTEADKKKIKKGDRVKLQAATVYAIWFPALNKPFEVEQVFYVKKAAFQSASLFTVAKMTPL